MVVGSLGGLWAKSMSPPPVTVTVFVTRAIALAPTFTVTMRDGKLAPGPRASVRLQLTVEPVAVGQVQPVPLAAVAVSPAGSVSVTVTAVPSVGCAPWFVMLMV